MFFHLLKASSTAVEVLNARFALRTMRSKSTKEVLFFCAAADMFLQARVLIRHIKMNARESFTRFANTS